MEETVWWEVWEQTYNTFGDADKSVVGRFEREDTANLVRAMRDSGWGVYVWVEKHSEVPLSDATPADVKKDPQKFGIYRRFTHDELRRLTKGLS